jgi:histidine triad (HIT) family protein
MADCIFCRIVRGEAPAQKVYEDEATVAFLDSSQISPGHCLVIPKKHIVWFTDMMPGDAGPFSRAVYTVARRIKKVMNAEYVSILIRGTRVPHLHALLVPKLPGHENILDQTLNLHQFFQTRQAPVASNEELERIAERIRKAE